MSHKIYNLEVLVGDMVYEGKDIRAKDQNHALQILGLISGGEVTEDSEVLFIEENIIH
jgi:hypothetical protein|tara:strand:+ start:362 stop:535 length:174 start_codon:yes stop_codon:yes gene_type:complete